MAFKGRRIYLGGYVLAIGNSVNESGVATFKGGKWKSLPQGPEQMPPLLGVMTVDVFRGDLYAGGYFTQVSGRPTCGFARWNGQRWTNPAGTNGTVLHLRRTPTGVLVAGKFDLPGIPNPVAIARYNGRRWTVLMESAAGGNPYSFDTAIQSEQLDTGEIFATDGTRLMRFDGAQWSPMLTPNGSSEGFGKYELTKFGGRLVAAVTTWLDTTEVPAIYVWAGQQWQKLGGDFEEILAAAGNERSLFIVHRIGSTAFPRNYVVSQWTGMEWRQLSTNTFTTDYARMFVGPGDAPFVTGTFAGVSPTVAAGMIRWNGTRWEPLLKGDYQGVNGIISSVFAFSQHSDGIYMGGSFSTAGDLFDQGIARWDGERWRSVGGGLHTFPNQRIRALASSGPTLYAAGTFTNVGGVAVSNIAAWDGTNWMALGSGVRSNVLALNTWNGSVIVGGRFSGAGEVEARNIVQWNGATWQPLGDGCDRAVAALTTWRGDLYAGGSFSNAGGVTSPLVARWNGLTWQDVGGGLGGFTEPGDPRLDVSAFAATEHSLYVGGQFQIAGSTIATNLARWDGTNWHSVGFPFTSPYDSVFALAVRGSNLYVGGIWTDETGKRSALLRKWDGKNWTSLGSGVGDQASNLGRIYTLLMTDEELFVGGRFTWAGNRASSSVARWIERPTRH